MSPPRVEIKALHPRFDALGLGPRKMSAEASGYDLAAALDEPLTLAPAARALVPCGFAMAMPAGMEAQVRPRSGLAHKHGVTLLNSPGTIDADYRGEVKVILINHGHEPFLINPGDRVAQLVFAHVDEVALGLADALAPSTRDRGGFGSTGS